MHRVLIADDEVWIRRNIRKMIRWEQLGLEFVGEAEDGLTACALAESLRPDIVVTDVRMPGLDGLQLVEKLSALLPTARMIIVSGYDEFEYVRKAINLKVVSYLLKPIDEEELHRVLAEAAVDLERFKESDRLRGNIPYLNGKITADLLESGDERALGRFRRWIAEKAPDMVSYAALVVGFDTADYEGGIQDLYAFNKLCREAWGLSPRELRKRGIDAE